MRGIGQEFGIWGDTLSPTLQTEGWPQRHVKNLIFIPLFLFLPTFPLLALPIKARQGKARQGILCLDDHYRVYSSLRDFL